jgi:hypothetical protein
MFIGHRQPKPHGAVRGAELKFRDTVQSLFRSSERRMVFAVLGSINISLLRSVVHIPAWSKSHFEHYQQGTRNDPPKRS